MRSSDISKAEAIQLVKAGFTDIVMRFTFSISAPLFWVIREEDGYFIARNGTVFFLHTGARAFAATADHVIAGLEQDVAQRDVVAIQLLNMEIPADSFLNRVIDRNSDTDICTLDFGTHDVETLGKQPIFGTQSAWPPDLRTGGKGIFFSGFSRRKRSFDNQRDIDFVSSSFAGIATSVSEKLISYQVESEYMVRQPDRPDFQYGLSYDGMSGSPMIAAVDANGLFRFALAGVLIEGPNNGAAEESISDFELFRFRPARFIGSLGEVFSLDHA